MTKQMWILAGVIAVVAVITGYVVKTKNDQASTDNTNQSQLPADEAAANYNVPPTLGMSVNGGGGIQMPNPDSAIYTTGQGNSLPLTTY